VVGSAASGEGDVGVLSGPGRHGVADGHRVGHDDSAPAIFMVPDSVGSDGPDGRPVSRGRGEPVGECRWGQERGWGLRRAPGRFSGPQGAAWEAVRAWGKDLGTPTRSCRISRAIG